VGRWGGGRSAAVEDRGRSNRQQRHAVVAVAAAKRGGPVASVVSRIPSSLAQALPPSPPYGGTASSRWSSGRSGSPQQ
jgi:hypothetical protein